jgi:thiamine transport system permease protein
VVVAAGFNALIGPRGVLNELLMSWFSLTVPPIQLLNTLAAILLAHVFYNTTVILRVVGGAWSQLDTRLEQAGRILGASRLRTFLEITLPLLRPSILSATLLVFLFNFTSFGVILLLGGPRFATIEVEIYIQTLQLLNLPLAGLLSAIQLGATLLMTILYARLTGIGKAIPLMPRLRGEGSNPPRTWRERVLVVSIVSVLLVFLISPMAAMSVRSVTRFDRARGQPGQVESWSDARLLPRVVHQPPGGAVLRTPHSGSAELSAVCFSYRCHLGKPWIPGFICFQRTARVSAASLIRSLCCRWEPRLLRSV